VKKTGYNPEFKVDHMDAKGRVGEWLQSQTSIASDDTLSWSIVTTGPYMELLKGVSCELEKGTQLLNRLPGVVWSV
jgi:hypothetical protein